MISKPEDAVGKWYLSLFGETNAHSFVLEYLNDGWFFTLDIKRSSLTTSQRNIEMRFLTDPVDSPAEIEKLNRKLIDKVFKIGAKL